MSNLEKLSGVDIISGVDINILPPMLFGIIRWKKNIGSPSGDLCSGFRIRVEERTPSQFRDLGGGNYEKIPGTGEWRLVTDSAPCSPSADEGDSYVVRFNVPNVKLNALDGAYRITPQLTNQWNDSWQLWVLFGFRKLDPLAWVIALRPKAHIATVEFEVVRKSRLWFS